VPTPQGDDGAADLSFVEEVTREIAPVLRAGTVVINKSTMPVGSTRLVQRILAEAGATAIRTRVGHSFIKGEMARHKAVFGGEHSAHYYFRDFWFADTGMLAAMHVLAALGEQSRPLSELVAEFSRYVASGEINSTVSDVPVKLQQLKERYGPDAGRVSHMDGISFEFDDWHFNVRPSNTEPLLRLNLEASSAAEMERRRDEVLALIRS